MAREPIRPKPIEIEKSFIVGCVQQPHGAAIGRPTDDQPRNCVRLVTTKVTLAEMAVVWGPFDGEFSPSH